MPYQSKLKVECSSAVESGGGVRGEGRGVQVKNCESQSVCAHACAFKAEVLKAGGLVRETLVEDMVLTTSGAAALLDPLDRQAWKGM